MPPTSFYRMLRYRVGDCFCPVDMGIQIAFKHHALTIGVGLIAGSVFPESNRLIFDGISPCWHDFYVSSMGGAALVFERYLKGHAGRAFAAKHFR